MAFLSEYKKFPLGPPIAGSTADPDSKGYIYIIGFAEAGIVKIGSAISIGCRMVQMQSGNPFELKLLAAVSVYDLDPVYVEFAAHKMAKRMGAHIRGEWFELGEDDALRCVIEAAKSKRTRYGPASQAMQRVTDKVSNDNATYEIERRAAMRKRLGMD